MQYSFWVLLFISTYTNAAYAHDWHAGCAIPLEQNVQRGEVFYRLVCDERADLFFIESYNFQASPMEKKTGMLDSKKCIFKQKELNKGVLYNGYIHANPTYKGKCKLTNDVEIHVSINYEERWQVESNVLKENEVITKKVFDLPVSAEIRLYQKSKNIFSYSGLNPRASKIIIDAKNQYIRTCSTQRFAYERCIVSTSFTEMSSKPKHLEYSTGYIVD